MSKNDMCEALYALPEGVIVKHRRPLSVPMMIFAAGVALLVINSLVEGTADYANLKSTLVLFGAVLAIIGVVLVSVRLGGGSYAPYHTGDRSLLKIEELKFSKDKGVKVAEYVRNGDFEALRSLHSEGVSAVTAVLFTSPRSGFAACQAFEFADLETRPICDMKVVYGTSQAVRAV